MLNIKQNGYKFLLKAFLLNGIPFSVMSSIFYTFEVGVYRGIIRGVTTGIFFGIIMGLYFLSHRRKFKKYVDNVLNTEPVIHDGEASVLKRFEAVNGWLFLTKDFLIFKSHKLNLQDYETEIDIREITSVTTGKTLIIVPDKLIIEKIDGKVEKFTVNNRDMWVEKINELIK